MTDDLMERLRGENPLPEDLGMLPIEPVLARIDNEPRARHVDLQRPRRVVRGLAAVVSVAVALGVVAAATVAGGHGSSTAPTTSSNSFAQRISKVAASQFAVFARRQTAKDRSLPMLLRRSIKLGGLGPGFGSEFSAVIPSLTRYTQTLPDGREVFLTAERFPGGLASGARRHVPLIDQLIIGVVIVQPDGKWVDGQPVTDMSGAPTAADAYLMAKRERGSCSLDTYSQVVPDQVARIRWQFGRQDQQGYVYGTLLTVNMTVHGNVAATTIPQRASCERPAAITLYGHRGQVLSHTGNYADLNRITRPVRHGDPFGYKRLEHRPRPNVQKR